MCRACRLALVLHKVLQMFLKYDISKEPLATSYWKVPSPAVMRSYRTRLLNRQSELMDGVKGQQNREELIEDQSDPKSASLGMLKVISNSQHGKYAQCLSGDMPCTVAFKPVRLSAATPLLCRSCSLYEHTRCSTQPVIFEPNPHTSPCRRL